VPVTEALAKTTVYPNPTAAQTTIEFSVGRKDKVTLEIFNAEGKKVSVLANGTLEKGRYQKKFSASSSGVYTYQLNIGERKETGKIVIKK